MISKKIKIFTSALILISALLFLFAFSDRIIGKKEELSLDIMMNSLKAAHYSPLNVDDSLSSKIFNLYIKRLDYSKKFFTQQDINALSPYKYQLDDEIKNDSFEFFKKATDIINKRVSDAEKYYKEALAMPFDLEKSENIETDPEKQKFAATESELKEEWRKAMKYQTMYKLAELQEVQENDKSKSDTAKKTFSELEKKAREKILSNNDDYFKRLKKLDATERFSVFLNAIANIYDPHTEFFPPKEKKQFDIIMTGQLEGIGAQLQEKDGYIKVSNIVPGSASWKQGQLKAGDIILKVAQGDKEPVDVVEMSLDNAVELIRGKKGTEVRLTVKKSDATIIVIPIIRDVVILEETFAQSFIVKNKKTIGYIKLPSFYSDFNGTGAHRSAVDVKKEVLKLKAEGVKGIILDLRDNGGGSLQDAVDMAGLFIPYGPIVQVKSNTGAPGILQDSDPQTIYDGPFIIMVNYNSASASEIVAAAMQDYNRAVIVGTPSTFGKGTVQLFLKLDDYLLPDFDTLKPLGDLKITFQKFYRINGGATQLKGVIPDIILPDVYNYIETGEKDQDFPMIWDEIQPANYQKWNKLDNKDKLQKNSEARVKENPVFSLVQQKALELKAQKDKTTHTLNYTNYIIERKQDKEKNKNYEEAVKKEIPKFYIENLNSDLQNMKTDSIKITRNKEWIKNLKKDFYLYEVSNIIDDMK